MKPYFLLLLLFPSFYFPVLATDVYNDGILELPTNWNFYPGKFLSAEEMERLHPSDKYVVDLTQNWAKLKKAGKNFSAMGIGTYYKQIILKNRETTIGGYELQIGNVMSAYQLFVNGKLVLRQGNPTTDKQGFKPMCSTRICHFDGVSDTVKLVLQVSNFYHPTYGGVYHQSKILLGKSENIDRYSFLHNALFFFLFSCLILYFILQIVFGFINSKEPIHFLIAILSLLTAFEILKENDAFWFSFFPHFDMALSDKLWYLIYPSILLVLLITRLSFQDLVNKYVEKMFYALYAIILPVFAVNDSIFMFRYSAIPALVNVFCVFYILFVLIKAVIKRKAFSQAHIISFVILCIGMANDILYTYEITDIGSLLSIGVLTYIVIQSNIVLIKFGRSRKLAIKLSHELEEINRNLEQIVEKRTMELEHANEELVRINMENMNLAEQKAKILQNELSKKEREMITAAVSIFQNKKLFSALKEEVLNEKNKFSNAQITYLKTVVDKYNNMANSFNWELFEKRFAEIHQDFYIHLAKDFSELTTNDLKLCALFRIGLSMKEIAILSYSNYEAVRKSVYRIRKKMGLNEKMELSLFLQGY